MKSFLKLGLLFLALTITTSQATAQLAANPAVMQLVQAELNKRGLTETEVRARLLQEGINVDAIQPGEIESYRGRVTAILDKMQNEKKQPAAGTPAGVTVNVAPTSTTPAMGGTGGQAPSTLTGGTQTTPPALEIPVTTVQEAAAEAEQRVIQEKTADQNTNIYGHALFTGKSLDVFRTTDGAEAPDTYVLGEGDEIRISIFGASQTDIQQRVASDGSIQPYGVAKVFVKGLTLKQVRSLLRERLSYSYSFRPDQFAISIVTARTVMINIFGEVKVTGSFNMSALNSAFNALTAAGGPTSIGSVRNIQLIRGSEKKVIDLYAFMSDPSKQFDFALQNNDIIYVPVLKNLVNITGAVKRPMQYEVKSGEDLSDLIKLAGGLTVDVYPEFVQIKRYVNGEEKYFEYKLSDVLNGKKQVDLENGDVVAIKTISKPMENYVEINGSVYYPGRFDLQSNGRLSQLLANAQPNFQAKTDLIFVERTRPDNTIEFLTVLYGDGKDFQLQARDVVKVLSLETYADQLQIAVVGAVRTPFERNISFADKLTVGQALEIAGGLKPTAYSKAYLFRKNWINPEQTTYINIDLTKDTTVSMQAGDRLNVYDNSTFTEFGTIRVSGAVKSPLNLTFDTSLTLKDVLINAGGFNIGAAYNKVQVFRLELSPNSKVKMQEMTLEVDTNFNLVSPKNFQFQPFDHVVVRMTPEFNLGRSVEINGQVSYPGIYMIESRETTLADVIKMAGGLLPDADRFGSKLFRTFQGRGNVTIDIKKAIENPNSYRHNPVVFEGDVININRTENTVTILGEATRMAQYSINPEQYDKRNVVFQGRKSARWYIREFAGGFQRNADKRSVTVTLPNNQMRSTKSFLWIKFFPKVEPGSTISLRMDKEKVLKEMDGKEKLELETVLAKGLQTMVSTASLILLLQRL